MKPSILYVFGGEKAQGAEIVIERLMYYNSINVDAHLFISPGKFASKLLAADKPYKITVLKNLEKLNRSDTNIIGYIWKAISNYFVISYLVYKYIRVNKIQIIHANTIVPASYLIPLIIFSKLFFGSRIWLWSDHDISYFSKVEIYLSKICAKLYNYTLVVSDAVKRKYVNERNVIVLYNGLDTDVFKPSNLGRESFRKAHLLSMDEIIIGMPGVVHPRKGQLNLIHVFNSLFGIYKNVRLLLAGGYEAATPQYTQDVKTQIAAHDHIEHLGYIEKMPDFYNGCDIIVNNSDIEGSEPLGTTIYEAMACEKIVIATLTGGSPEIVEDQENGFLVEAGNTMALTRLLIDTIRNIEKLNNLKIAARELVKKKFNIYTMLTQYNNLIFQAQK